MDMSSIRRYLMHQNGVIGGANQSIYINISMFIDTDIYIYVYIYIYIHIRIYIYV